MLLSSSHESLLLCNSVSCTERGWFFVDLLSVVGWFPFCSRFFFLSSVCFLWQDSQRTWTGFLGQKEAPQEVHVLGDVPLAVVVVFVDEFRGSPALPNFW